jgi:peptidoglycan/LPS O-acetylase OafA/YrhL
VTLDRAFARLSRRTSSGRYIPEIDGLRFVAIALVVAFHAALMLRVATGHSLLVPPFGRQVHRPGAVLPQAPSWPVAAALQGWFGVELFFVISGFILALPFVSAALDGGRPVALKRYYLRRVTRLEPPYLLALTCFFILALAFGLANQAVLAHYAAGLAYAHGIAFQSINPVNAPVWSLEVEIQFYVLMPLMASVFRIRNRRVRRGVLVGTAAAAIALQPFASTRIPAVSLTMAAYVQFFLAGFLLADIYVIDWRQRPRPRLSWDLVSFAGWPLLFVVLYRWRGSLLAFTLPCAVVLLYCAAFRGSISSALFRNRSLITIGGMCYSIYLLHYPLLVLLTRVTRHLVWGSFNTQVLLQIAWCTPVLLAFGLVFYVAVERPCMEPDWPSRLIARIRGTTELQPTADTASR